MHPIAAPTFRCRPDLVSGIPIFLDNLDFAAEIPSSRFHENPPLFILASYLVAASIAGSSPIMPSTPASASRRAVAL